MADEKTNYSRDNSESRREYSSASRLPVTRATLLIVLFFIVIVIFVGLMVGGFFSDNGNSSNSSNSSASFGNEDGRAEP